MDAKYERPNISKANIRIATFAIAALIAFMKNSSLLLAE
jgi:hypothetical protein